MVGEFAEKLAHLSLVRYASEAAGEMGFGSVEELHHSVKRAMEICLSAGILLKGNFQRVYSCSDQGIVYDWKLSLLAYKLVCLCGYSCNPQVAALTIELVRKQHISKL
ncbi:MAG: damage-inducible protein D [Bacteroidota bacterium]